MSIKFFSLSIVVTVSIFISVVYHVGSRLIQRSYTHKVYTYQKAKTIEFLSCGKKIFGLIYEGKKDAPIIALFHPLGGSKESMNSRVEFFRSQGYWVVTIDFNAHGESEGEYKTFGYIESQNVSDLFSYLQKNYPKQKKIALGVSLGGASIILSHAPFDAIIVETVYNDIETAIKNRLSMKLGNWAKNMAWLLSEQLPLRIGVDVSFLNPANAAKSISIPTFVIGGEKDERATMHDIKQIYNNIPKSTIKKLWIVKNAKHTNFHTFAKKEYEQKVLSFLQLVLGS